jgi:transcriptional regulator with XRE-family HTH domain
VDTQRVATAIRTARVRHRLRQSDVASSVGVSRTTISRVERGALRPVPLGVLMRIAAAVEIDLDLRARSRGSDVDRLVNAGHAALAERTLRWIGEVASWVVRPELSFSIYGERGVIDIAAWHPATRALLVVEIKTAIVDVGELLGTLDRKIRLATAVVAPMGWNPVVVGACLIVAESSTNRRAIRAHGATFRAALPDGIAPLRRWLRAPAGPLRALAFVSDDRARNVRTGFAVVRRVRSRSTHIAEHERGSRGSAAPRRAGPDTR